MNNKMVIGLVLAFLLGFSSPVYGDGQSNGGYFTFVDENQQEVYSTAWQVQVGDECLTEDNRRYEVVGLDGNTAKVKFIGRVNLSAYLLPQAPGSEIFSLLAPRIARAQGGKIAIYHTHDDESYVRSDGTESITGNGGIYKVGNAFASALESKGMQVVHSTNKHDPHDSSAYDRSRRTASELLKQQPAAIFDVHRDALPEPAYRANINGVDCTKVQLVVGKYGPTGKQIEDYALQVKAASDQQHPGLVKGIFFAKGGDYNQDLHPRSLLLEVGSHTNTREEAERGIALFADAVPTVLGATSGNPGNVSGTTGFGSLGSGLSGASKSIVWVVGLLIAGAAVFLFLSTGSFKEASSKLRQFGSTEFANYFGPKVKADDRKNEQDKDKNSDKQDS